MSLCSRQNRLASWRVVLLAVLAWSLCWAASPRAARASILVASDSSTAGNSDVLNYGTGGSPLGTYLAGTAGALGTPQSIVFGPDGNLYVADSGQDKIWKFDPTTGTLTTFVTTGANGLVSPNGLAFSAGNLYVADAGGAQVLEYDSSGTLVAGAPFIASGAGLIAPEGLAFDAAGHLFIGDAGHGAGTTSGQVLEYSTAGTLLQTLAAPGANGLDAATAVTLHNGDLYVANSTSGIGNSSVLKYDASTGNFIGTFATGLTSPTALVFDSTGNLFVADANAATNHVVEYDSAGNLIGTFIGVGSDGLGVPAGLALAPQPVPEPSTLLMFGLATAAVVAGRRKRRHRG